MSGSTSCSGNCFSSCLILLTAASSNHFQEAQAMLRNAHERLGPRVPNLKLVMYDLGLNTTERRLMEAHCNCTVLDFPFSDFPAHVSDLICYAWKPLMIHAHMSQAELGRSGCQGRRIRSGGHETQWLVR